MSDITKKNPRHTYGKTVVLRTAVDILFLGLFIVLIITGKIQLWFALFAAGLLVSTVAGRFYCGWICPMHTLMRPVEYLHKKLEKRRQKSLKETSRTHEQKSTHKRPAPAYGRRTAGAFFNGSIARYGVLVLFIAVAVGQNVLGFNAPALPILTAAAVILTVFFVERWWHSVLCPFGTLLNGASSKAKFGLTVHEDKCTGCGLCDKSCPAGAIIPVSPERTALRSIATSKCLLCFSCARACPFDAIRYGVVQPTAEQNSDEN